MTGPRPLNDPEPIVWAAFALQMVAAAVLGAGVVWWLTRGWTR